MEGWIGVVRILLCQFSAKVSDAAACQGADGQVGQHDSSSDEYTCQHGDTRIGEPDVVTSNAILAGMFRKTVPILGLPALFRPQVCRNLAALLNYHDKNVPDHGVKSS